MLSEVHQDMQILAVFQNRNNGELEAAAALLLPGKMMMEVERISEAFWRETPWGQTMKETLRNQPFPK